jgi:hypothetical protein
MLIQYFMYMKEVLVGYGIVFGRIVNVYNFQIIQMTKSVYFLLLNQIHCRTLITALVGIKIKCYLMFTYVRINFIGYLEIIALQQLRRNIFTVQYIRILHLQISLFRLKCTPSSCLCTVDVKNKQFFGCKVSSNSYERSLLYTV